MNEINAEQIANHIIVLNERAERAEGKLARIEAARASDLDGALKMIKTCGSGPLFTNPEMGVVRIKELAQAIVTSAERRFMEGKTCSCSVLLGAQRPHASTCGSLAEAYGAPGAEA